MSSGLAIVWNRNARIFSKARHLESAYYTSRVNSLSSVSLASETKARARAQAQIANNLPLSPCTRTSRYIRPISALCSSPALPAVGIYTPVCFVTQRRFLSSSLKHTSISTMSESMPLRSRLTPSSLVADQMQKPQLDTRSYRVVMLPNKLEVLLIHDPDTDKASAAMDVNIGSFSDSADLPGMAHAVEHLLFMGTKKVRIDRGLTHIIMLTYTSFQVRMITTHTSRDTVATRMHSLLRATPTTTSSSLQHPQLRTANPPLSPAKNRLQSQSHKRLFTAPSIDSRNSSSNRSFWKILWTESYVRWILRTRRISRRITGG